MKIEIIMKQNEYNGTFKTFIPNPSDKIAINSLSLLSFIKHKSNPKISIKGIITVYHVTSTSYHNIIFFQ